MTTRRRVLVGGFVAGGSLAAGLALWAALSEASSEVLPPAGRWVVAAGFAAIWLTTAAKAWVALFESPGDERLLTSALLYSQLGKYVPGGGVVQVSGMVAMSRSDRLTTTRLALGLPVIGLSVVAIGGVATAALAVADTRLPTWARVVSLVGLAAPLVLWRPIMATVLVVAHRMISRIPEPDQLPSQRAIVVSATWTTVSLVASAMGYAALVEPLLGDADLASLTVVFVVAWAAGFLALPLPGGLGVREAVLVGLIGGSTASIVGASIAHRVVNIVVELTAIALYWGVGRVAARRDRRPG